MKKLIVKFKAILALITGLISIFLPSVSMANINSVYDLKYESQQVLDKVSASPIFGVVGYSIALLAFFVFAIILVFILIMLLKD